MLKHRPRWAVLAKWAETKELVGNLKISEIKKGEVYHHSVFVFDRTKKVCIDRTNYDRDIGIPTEKIPSANNKLT